MPFNKTPLVERERTGVLQDIKSSARTISRVNAFLLVYKNTTDPAAHLAFWSFREEDRDFLRSEGIANVVNPQSSAVPGHKHGNPVVSRYGAGIHSMGFMNTPYDV